MIEFKNVCKNIGHNKIIKNVSFTIDDNDFCVIVGSNGSGKTTIINLILGLYKLNKHDSGDIIDDFRAVSFLPSIYNLPSLIGCHLFLYEYFKDIVDFSVINNYISRYKLQNKAIHELSKGNLQKLVLIKALLQKGDLYIFDEPLSGLDDDAKDEFIKDLINLKKNNKAIVIATHEKDMFKGLYNKVLEIRNGELI